MPGWLPLAVAGVGAVHLWAYYGGRPALAGTLKAVPVLLLAAAVLALAPDAARTYARFIAAGLVCSAVGDVCLVSSARFVPGLASFLVAHCCYLLAFATAGPPPAPSLGWLAGVLAIALVLLAVLWPHLGRLRWPVTAYVMVIGAMAWVALSRAGTPGVSAVGGLAAAAGALAFMLSDSLLAVNRFVRPLPAAHAWVMVTYYAAQTAIAASTTA